MSEGAMPTPGRPQHVPRIARPGASAAPTGRTRPRLAGVAPSSRRKPRRWPSSALVRPCRRLLARRRASASSAIRSEPVKTPGTASRTNSRQAAASSGARCRADRRSRARISGRPGAGRADRRGSRRSVAAARRACGGGASVRTTSGQGVRLGRFPSFAMGSAGARPGRGCGAFPDEPITVTSRIRPAAPPPRGSGGGVGGPGRVGELRPFFCCPARPGLGQGEGGAMVQRRPGLVVEAGADALDHFRPCLLETGQVQTVTRHGGRLPHDGGRRCRGRSNFRPPPRHAPQAPTTYRPKAGLAVEVCAAYTKRPDR